MINFLTILVNQALEYIFDFVMLKDCTHGTKSDILTHFIRLSYNFVHTKHLKHFLVITAVAHTVIETTSTTLPLTAAKAVKVTELLPMSLSSSNPFKF